MCIDFFSRTHVWAKLSRGRALFLRGTNDKHYVLRKNDENDEVNFLTVLGFDAYDLNFEL